MRFLRLCLMIKKKYEKKTTDFNVDYIPTVDIRTN